MTSRLVRSPATSVLNNIALCGLGPRPSSPSGRTRIALPIRIFDPLFPFPRRVPFMLQESVLAPPAECRRSRSLWSLHSVPTMTPAPLGGLWGGQRAPIVCSADDGEDDLDIGDDDSLTSDDPLADEESSFDDFDDDFDDDFEEEETDPDWDHPGDLEPEAPPPGKPSGGKK